MRRIAVVVALAFAMCGVGGAGAHTLRNPTRPVWLPPVAWSVAECETGLDVHHSTSGYVSAFGFARSVWEWFRRPDGRRDPDQHTYPADATRASLWQQWRVAARKVRHFHGWSGWGCYDHGGYLVWIGRA